MPTSGFTNSAADRPRRRAERLPARVVLAVVSLAVLAGSCGRKGPPVPPEPRGPLPPKNVRARQVGRIVEIGLIAPAARGSRPGQQLMSAELVRVYFPPGVTPSSDPDVFRRRGELLSSIAIEEPPDGTARMTLSDPDLAALAGQGVGHTLRYGVRLRDRRRRASPLVVAPDLIPLEDVPGPTVLTAEPTADGMRLVWDPPPGTGELSFNLYRREAGGEWPWAPLNATPLAEPSYLDSDVRVGRRYAYTVRVVLQPGEPHREGTPGPTREVLADDRFAPMRPSGLVVVQEGPLVRLFWDPNDERDLWGYRVYRSADGRRWERIGPDPVERPDYRDEDVRVGQRWFYRVTAIDRNDPPNESEATELFEVQVRSEPDIGGPGP